MSSPLFVAGVLLCSLCLQLVAAYLALRLVRLTGERLAWISVAAAILLMAIRRAITLYETIVAYPHFVPNLNAELVALLISLLMLIGVIAIKPVFEKLRSSEHRLSKEIRRNREILESCPDGFWLLNPDGKLCEVNQAYCQMVGYDQGTLKNMDLNQLHYAEVGSPVHDYIQSISEKGMDRFEVCHRHRHGQPVYLDVTAKYVELEEQRFIYIFLRDVTERKAVEVELFKEKERAQVTLQSIGDGVVTTDIHGRILYINTVMEELAGQACRAVVGRPLHEVIELVQEESRRPIDNPVARCVQTQDRVLLRENTLLLGHAGEIAHSVEVVISPIYDNAEYIVGVVLVFHDVTELRKMANRLAYQASHDALTGLINRWEFENRVEKALRRARQDNGGHAMVYVDLDEFKVVNDTCGHVAGDELLKQISVLLSSGVREQDSVARLGGDEFGILLLDCDIDEAVIAVQHLRDAIRDYRFTWEDNVFEVGLSVGLVPIDGRSQGMTELLSAADSACYVAKERGGDNMHVYTHDDEALARRYGQMQWIQRIQRGLEQNRFRLYQQAIAPLGATQPQLVEILLRMVDEDGTLVLPGDFLPAAERYHMMVTLDRWVVSHVLTHLRYWGDGDGRIFNINLSGQSLGDAEFLKFVHHEFEISGIDPERICFEITETAVIGNINQARRFIEELRRRGCQFALDDFGSGLSSFSYLKSLPVDYLKIDGNFVRGLLRDPRDYNLVISINQIGHVMGIDTIAEFVEDENTLNTLKRIGVDYAQGYAIARPQPLVSFRQVETETPAFK